MKKWTKQHRQRFQETLAAKKAALAHPPAASGGEARMRIARGQSFDGLLYDITNPDFPVQIQVSETATGSVLWVNVGPACVLRICRIREMAT